MTNLTNDTAKREFTTKGVSEDKLLDLLKQLNVHPFLDISSLYIDDYSLDETFTGKLTVKAKETDLTIIANFKNSIKDGSFKIYRNEMLRFHLNFKNNMRYNRQREYFEDGQISYDECYEEDKLHGLQISYHKNGVIKYIESYYKGEGHGWAVHFDENYEPNIYESLDTYAMN